MWRWRWRSLLGGIAGLALVFVRHSVGMYWWGGVGVKADMILSTQSQRRQNQKKGAKQSRTRMLDSTWMGWTTCGAAFWPRLDPRPAHVLLLFTCYAASAVSGPCVPDASSGWPGPGCIGGVATPLLWSHVPTVLPTPRSQCALEMLVALDMAGETTST
jgi:hypothetical protein